MNFIFKETPSGYKFETTTSASTHGFTSLCTSVDDTLQTWKLLHNPYPDPSGFDSDKQWIEYCNEDARVLGIPAVIELPIAPGLPVVVGGVYNVFFCSDAVVVHKCG